MPGEDLNLDSQAQRVKPGAEKSLKMQEVAPRTRKRGVSWPVLARSDPRVTPGYNVPAWRPGMAVWGWSSGSLPL